MKNFRSVLSGVMIWTMIFVLFSITSFIPTIKDSPTQQTIVVFLFLFPITMVGLSFFYRKGAATRGIILGSIIAITSLLLDAMITVPFVIIPHGGSYISFYSDPTLWIMGAAIMTIAYLYDQRRIKSNLVSSS